MAIDKNKIIEAATKFVQKGQYDKAIREYNKLLEADPRDARVQQKLGELYQKKGENNLAADCFLKVAESYSADGFFLKAVAVYKQVLKLNSGLISVNLKLAELHQQLGLMSDAMAQYQIVANHYDKVGDIRASLDILRRMIDLDPDNIASRIKLAELYAREQMNEEAVAEFRHCADYLKRNSRIDDYVKVAERLVFLDPSDIELTRELAGIYLAKQDTKRALAKLQLCFKADPRDVETLNMLAQAFKELGQLSKTVSVYKELARIYDEQDRVDEEREIWRRVLELAPEDPDAQARLAPRRAPVSSPTPPPTTIAPPPPAAPAHPAPPPAPVTPEQIAKLLTETDVYVKYGLHDKAVEHLKKVFAADPESIEAHEKAVHLYSVANDGAAHLDYLLRTIRLCLARGELERARTHVHRLCEKDPNHPEVPGFLQAIGGLAPLEEEAEIDDDAIIVEAADEVVEVAEEPENALPEAYDYTVEPLTDDEPLITAADDEVLAISDDFEETEAQLVADFDDTEAQVIVTEVDEDTDVHTVIEDDESFTYVDEPMSEVDDLALAAAADPDDELVTSDGLEDEPLVISDPGDDLALQAAVAEAELVGDYDAGFIGDEDTVETHIVDDEAVGFHVDDSSQAEEPTGPFALEPITDQPYGAETVEAFDDADAVEETTQVTVYPSEPDAGSFEVYEAAGVPAAEPIESADAAPEEPELDEFDEAAFFIEQGELEEARDILETVLVAYPHSRRAAELMALLEQKEQAAAQPAEEAPVDAAAGAHGEEQADASFSGDIAFDLAAELAAEDFGDLGFDAGPQPGDEDFQYSVEDVFEEFKKGVQKVVKPEDVDTHYDLGIAYKEMGLIDDAISEFEQALKGAVGKKKEIECLSMIGLARMEKGEYAEAIKAFTRGLGSDLVTADVAKALNYEIGAAYQQLGDQKAALTYFTRVYRNDPKYRDVAASVEALRNQLSDTDLAEVDGGSDAAVRPVGLQPGAGGDAPAGKSRKIGYV